MSTTEFFSKAEFVEQFHDLVLIPFFPSWDGPGEIEQGQRCDAQNIWEAITEGRWGQNIPIDTDEQRIKEMFTDACDDCCHAVTDSDLQNKRDREQREQLEADARHIAARYNVGIDSLEFIHAVESELDNRECEREGMREDGLCIGYGATAEQWQEAMSDSQVASNRLCKILNWLAEKCPLLWAEYQEWKREEARC